MWGAWMCACSGNTRDYGYIEMQGYQGAWVIPGKGAGVPGRRCGCVRVGEMGWMDKLTCICVELVSWIIGVVPMSPLAPMKSQTDVPLHADEPAVAHK